MSELVKSESSNELQVVNLEKVATWVKSGLLPANIKTPEQGFLVISKGGELGLKPLESFEFIDIIQNKPTLKPKGMGALIKRGGVKYKTLQDFEPLTDDKGAVVDFITSIEFNRDGEVEIVTYKYSDATNMGLTTKDNWKKQPATMMYWRCLSKGANRVCPDLISGMYNSEEVAAFTPGVKIEITEEGDTKVTNE